jgi:hypothetical protein
MPRFRVYTNLHVYKFPLLSNQVRQTISPIGSFMFVKSSFKKMNNVKIRLSKDLLGKMFSNFVQLL